MSNSCYFEMHIKGNKGNVTELVKMMNSEGKYEKDGIDRVGFFDIIDKIELDSCQEETINTNCLPDNYVIWGEGECAWSVLTSMLGDVPAEYVNRDLVTTSKLLNLTIEVYSEEPGLAFQEHYIIERGTVKCSDCIYWGNFDLDLLETDKDYLAEFLSHTDYIDPAITSDNCMEYIKDMADDGTVYIGGCKWEFMF